MAEIELEGLKVRMRGPYREDVDAPKTLAGPTFLKLVDAFRDNLKDTALVKGEEVTQRDVDAIKRAQRETALINPWVFNQGTQETNFLVARYARLLGKHFRDATGLDLNLEELEARAHLHDVGRGDTHRRYVNDRRGEWILSQAGVPPNFLASMPSDEHWWPVDASGKRAFRIEDIGQEATLRKYININSYEADPVMGIVEMADILGKLVEGRLMRWEELEEVSLRGRLILPNQDKCGPQEFVRMTSVVTNIDGVIEFYRRLGRWMESQIGIKMAKMVSMMEDELTYNPLPKTYHQELGSFPFDTVIWDLGGVVFKGGATESNTPLYDPVLEAYGFKDPALRQRVIDELELLIKECGVRVFDDEVAKKVIEVFGMPRKEFSMTQILRNDADSYRLDWDAVRMMLFLKNEGVRTFIASNTEQNGFHIMLSKLSAAGVKTGIINSGTIEDQRTQMHETESQGLIPAFASYLNGVRKGRYSIREDDRGFYDVIRDVLGIRVDALIIDDKLGYTEEGLNAFKGIPYLWIGASIFEQWMVNQLKRVV